MAGRVDNSQTGEGTCTMTRRAPLPLRGTAADVMQDKVTVKQASLDATARTNAELNAFFDALNRWTGAEPRPAPIYQRGVETRAHIVTSARATFVRQGYIDCTVEDILNAASISRGTFYSHFRNKKAAFAAVVEQHVTDRINRTNVTDLGDFDYRDRVRATIGRFLDDYAATGDFGMVIEQAAYYDPEFRTIRLVIRDIFIRRIALGIERQQRLGAASTAISADMAAMTIVSMMTNVAQVEVGWRGRKPNDAMIDSLVTSWCAGIGLLRTID